MSTNKHLVLDDDVHEALEERKHLTGSTIRDIGNSVLRTSMGIVFLTDILGRILAEKGIVSEGDYNDALDQASSQLTEIGQLPVQVTVKGTAVAGSWEIRQLFCRSDNAFQVLESWTRDLRQLPMDAHQHAADEFFVLFSGRVVVTMSGVPYSLCPLNMIQVPSGVVHSVKPVADDCHLIAILSPAVRELFTGNNTGLS